MTRTTQDTPSESAAHLLTGAESIAHALARHGYSTVFAYPGTSELALSAAIAEHDDLRLVNSRGDKEAAFMAAGETSPAMRAARPSCTAPAD